MVMMMRAGAKSVLIVTGAAVCVGAGFVLFSGCIPDPSDSIRAMAELEAERNEITLAMVDTVQLAMTLCFCLCVVMVGIGAYFAYIAIIRSNSHAVDIHHNRRISLNSGAMVKRIERNQQAAADCPVIRDFGFQDDRYVMIPMD